MPWAAEGLATMPKCVARDMASNHSGLDRPRVPGARDDEVVVVGANGLAVRAIHNEMAAHGGSSFVDSAIHMCGVQGDTPSLLPVSHHLHAFWRPSREISGNTVF